MADRITTDVQSLEKRPYILAGSFQPNGSSAIDATTVRGKGFTVAYTSTGLYTVTVADSYAALISGTVTLQLNAVADTYLQLTGAIDPTSRSWTFKISNYDISGTGVADIANHANAWIHFSLVLRNSSI